MSTSTTHPETLTARDGTSLALRWWKGTGRIRGTVVIVHGLGEHGGRYQKVGMHLTKQSWDVVACDLRGHGRSGGPRGGVRTADDFTDDLSLVMDAARQARPGGRIVLLGHSMGGLIAAQLISRRLRPADALILSSPALAARVSLLQRLQVAIGSLLLPGIAVKNRLKVDRISHHPAVVSAYKADPLVHDRITPRLARLVLRGGAEVLAAARDWQTPTLLLWALDDHLVDPAGSSRLAGVVPAHLLRAKGFSGLYHEIFNELHPEPVYEALDEWLEERFPTR